MACVIANKMVSRGPQALALAKQAVRRGVHMPMQDALALEAASAAVQSMSPCPCAPPSCYVRA